MHTEEMLKNMGGLDELYSDEYWKLGSHEFLSGEAVQLAMEEQDFYYPKSAKKARLMDLYHRMDRGLISYQGCSVTELQRFVQDRYIETPALGLRSKAAMVDVLEKADDAATFERFADLPPELRTRIYAAYFEDLVLPLCPNQPPLSKVSRMVREEALPLFYSTCQFPVRVIKVRGYRQAQISARRWRARATDDFSIVLDESTARLFRQTEKSNVSRIKKLAIELQTGRYGQSFKWNLDLNLVSDDERGLQIDENTTDWLAGHLALKCEKSFAKAITPLFHQILIEIASRPEAHKLQEGDITAFKTAMIAPANEFLSI